MDKKTKKRINQLNFLKKNSRFMRLAAQGWDEEWKTLISTMMSAQSRDEVTIIIAQKLFKKYPSIKKLSKAEYNAVIKILSSLNYNKTKTKNIIKCSKIIFNKFNNKVPRDFEKLITLPGVGRKTANVFLSEVGESTIGIDTHVNYISHKLDWTNSKTQEKIEEDIKKEFPKKYWKKINEILVMFGKTHTSKKQKDLLLEKVKKMK